MKFYRCSKSILKWKEMQQISFNWKMPILIDTDSNVLLGNSLKDSLPDTIIVTKMDNYLRDVLFQALFEIETNIALENSFERISTIEGKVKEYLTLAKKPLPEYIPLFELRDATCVTLENYIEPPPYDFNKHKDKSQLLFNGGFLLSEDFREEVEEEDPEIEVDLEILKELL